MEIIDILTNEFNVKRTQVENTLKLIDEGNTIPFIARYRKEVTGSLDDTVLRDLNDRLTYLRNLEKRREEVKSLIAGQDKLTPEIEAAIDNATTLTEIEDIYRPFKPHRKTRASVARERGLEDLALTILLQQDSYEKPLEEIAADYINEELGVNSAEEALAGACDIIAEDVSDNAEYRKTLRSLAVDCGSLVTKQAKKEPSVYELYYDYSEKLNGIPPHRILAINRGEKEDFLKVSIEIDSAIPLNYLFTQVMENQNSPAKKYVSAAVIDSYEHLIAPSIEREIRSSMFDDASENSIRVFSVNLRNLLMQSPLKGKVVLGYDPGYRTGCKLAIVDRTGKVIDTAVIYPTKPHERIEESKKIVKNFIRKYGVDAIAIGNGTASKESEIFIADVLREIGNETKYIIVNEAGASVYSASKLAADEFPDFDVTQRSAVSIARRLQDPLAELVKIDPKSIGVGQYQHDMKQARLDEALGGVVENCVNSVGVDLNTASHSLLSYIAGINSTIAKNIVKYREENGEFAARAQILKVPRLGAKAYEQCAGFLRVTSSDEILDNTGVHPESYDAARALLKKFKFTAEDVKNGNLADLRKKAESHGMKALSDELSIGEPTLLDIIAELEKPGRDLRDSLPPPMLRTDVMDLSDLKPDMLLKGTVRNVIDFGAFVDIGVHQDGLVHISEMSDKYIAHPSAVLSVGDQIYVRVKSVDVQKKRIALILKGVNQVQA
jgi:Transcriptional accessory protein